MKRVPRPFGTTILNAKQDKEVVIRHIIKIYTLNNYTVNQTPLTFAQLAAYLQVPLSMVMAEVSNQGLSMMEGLMSEENQAQAYQSLIGMALFGVLGDRQKLEFQLQLVAKSQGKAYKPFVTAEYNNLLSTLIRSQGGLIEIAKMFKPSHGPGPKLPLPTGPTQNINGNVIYQNGPALTVDKAMELIQGAQSQNLAENLAYQLEGAPEVSAIGQESEALRIDSILKETLPKPDEETDLHSAYKANGAGLSDFEDHSPLPRA